MYWGSPGRDTKWRQKKKMRERDEEVEFLKRQAAHIAAQLPNGRRDALVVLDYAREIILNLGKDGPIRLVSQIGQAVR